MRGFAIILPAAVFAMFLQSCSALGPEEGTMLNAEACMEERPEQALEMLRSMELSDLTTRKTQARYSLLLSMALDKNYVDVANDSIIAPAVVYYKNHGCADERLKTCYYWGRVAMNAGDYEDAISRFTIAEKYAGKASDKLAVGRLYKAQTSVYQYCYDTDAMIEAGGKAAVLYMSIGDTSKYIASLFDITAAFAVGEDGNVACKGLRGIAAYFNRAECADQSTRGQLGRHSDQ